MQVNMVQRNLKRSTFRPVTHTFYLFLQMVVFLAHVLTNRKYCLTLPHKWQKHNKKHKKRQSQNNKKYKVK